MFEIGDEKYEELRLILEKQNGRTYTPEEAKEIGDGVLDFYQTLINLEADAANKESTTADF